jgi:peptide/nickel transport system substrate-binding protein
MNKKILKTLGLILTILVLVGFGKTVTSEKKTGNDTALKETLVIAQKSDAKTLDPQKSIDTVSNKVMQMIFDTLTIMDENLNIQPGLAEKWERVDDYSMIFHLRKGVKFHNGDILTSEDVKYSFSTGFISF